MSPVMNISSFIHTFSKVPRVNSQTMKNITSTKHVFIRAKRWFRALVVKSLKLVYPQTQYVLEKILLAHFLGDDVSYLILYHTVSHHYISLGNIVSQKVMSHINIHSPLLMNKILCHVHCTCVVTHERINIFEDTKIFKLLPDPQEFSISWSNNYKPSSALDKAMRLYFLVPHEISDDPTKGDMPKVFFLSIRKLAYQRQHIQSNVMSLQNDRI